MDIIYLCNMLSVERHIAYLVSRHDCVIVPGFGAFVSLYMPAAFNSETDTFYPPTRKIGFNPDINHNDAMLAASISRREDISYDRAVEIVKIEAESWNKQIETLGTLALEGIGSFTLDSESNKQFSPDAVSCVSNTCFYGLPELDGLRADTGSCATPADNRPRPIRRLSARVAKAAASIAIIASILAAMFTVTLTPDSPLYYASFFPSSKIADESTVQPDRPIIQPHNAELRLAMIPDKEGTVVHVSDKRIFNPSNSDADDRYYLVVASLANDKETSRYLSSLPEEQRSKLKILKGSGRHRVYVASGKTFADANNARYSGNNAHLYPDAWVYVKH